MRKLAFVLLAAAASAALIVAFASRGGSPSAAQASSHREAPLIAEDPPREAVGDAAEAVVELAERDLVGAGDERHEGFVREVGEISRHRGPCPLAGAER